MPKPDRIQYVMRRRAVTRNSRSTMGNKVTLLISRRLWLRLPGRGGVRHWSPDAAPMIRIVQAPDDFRDSGLAALPKARIVHMAF